VYQRAWLARVEGASCIAKSSRIAFFDALSVVLCPVLWRLAQSPQADFHAGLLCRRDG
jgi:hypothetical protein